MLITRDFPPLLLQVLLLDEPTNHLDLEACVWLEQHLASYAKCLIVISHSQAGAENNTNTHKKT